jgi:hypothetical protein
MHPFFWTFTSGHLQIRLIIYSFLPLSKKIWKLISKFNWQTDEIIASVKPYLKSSWKRRPLWERRPYYVGPLNHPNSARGTNKYRQLYIPLLPCMVGGEEMRSLLIHSLAIRLTHCVRRRKNDGLCLFKLAFSQERERERERKGEGGRGREGGWKRPRY